MRFEKLVKELQPKVPLEIINALKAKLQAHDLLRH